MQCCLNGVQISEVPTFLAKSPSEITHVIKLTDLFNADHPLIIPLQMNRVISSFDVYSSSIAEYENDDMPKIHLTVEEPPWDPSTNEY